MSQAAQLKKELTESGQGETSVANEYRTTIITQSILSLPLVVMPTPAALSVNKF